MNLDYSKVPAKAIFYKFDYARDNLQDYYLFIEDTFDIHYDKVPIPFELLREFREILKNRANNL